MYSKVAEDAFNEGKKYNLDTSAVYAPTLARCHFEIAGRQGHAGAARSLALMLHQGAGGRKDLAMAIKWLSIGYFRLGDSESLECLENVLQEEIEAGQTAIQGVDLARLAIRVESLRKMSDRVRDDVRMLCEPTRGRDS